MKRKLGKFILFFGIVAILSGIGIIVYNLWDENRANNKAMQILQEIEEIEITMPEKPIESSPPFIELNGEYYIGTISIPKLSLELPINNELDDARMKNSPCRYVGDFSSQMVISAHNYNKHFGGISKLSYGDAITITDGNGKEHPYKVELTEILHQTEVDAMINSPYDLTLFTCTKSRVDRITIRCSREQPADSESAEEDNPENYIVPDEQNLSEAPNYIIDYKKEIIKLKKGYIYSTDGGDNFTEATTESISLDVSDYITNGISIHIKKTADKSEPASKIQVIIPITRATLDSQTLTPERGRLKLDKKYEVYDSSTNKWGNLPPITTDTELEIRIKNTVEISGENVTGNASSVSGKLIITYGLYNTKSKRSGIITAEIIT